jgi:hypothetical protein
MQLFPTVDSKELHVFRETYGPSAFVCRYLYCTKATDGFDTLRERDSHEATHQRKFRCAYSTCVHFARGFATRAVLNKHNEMYHNIVKSGRTLASAIAAQKTARPSQATEKQQREQGLKLPWTQSEHDGPETQQREVSPFMLPRLLSPDLPDIVEAELLRIQREGSFVNLILSTKTEPINIYILKLKYKKRRAHEIQRILGSQPRPDKLFLKMEKERLARSVEPWESTSSHFYS